MNRIVERKAIFLSVLLFALCFNANAQRSKEPQTISFSSGSQTLQGYLWVPEGDGPFRAIVWSYGKQQRLMKQGSASEFAELAKLYLENNYVLFIPDRSPGEEDRSDTTDKEQKFADANASMNNDLIAALSWLRQQSFVDATKVAVSGTMTGALQALLATERDATIRAAVVFSPGSISWDKKPGLPSLLRRTVKNTEVPTFLIQPQNDNSLKPTEILGPILLEKGGLNRTKIYPPFAGDFRVFATDSTESWGTDVIGFLDAAMN